MIKLTYNTKKDVIVMIQSGKTVAFLDTKDFGMLVREVMRIMREADPNINKKQKRREERKALMNNLKMLLAIKFIDTTRKVKGIFQKKK